MKNLEKENQEMKALLLELGTKTHESKKLYEWYIKNEEQSNE